MILWCDIETEGLGLMDHRILEIGFILTDDALREYGSWSSLVLPLGLSERTCDPEALKLHKASGLWDELQAVTARRDVDEMIGLMPPAVQGKAIDWVTKNVGDKPTMAGSSIHFDKGMIDRHMPDLGALFDYRMIDVSSIRALAKRWRPGVVFEDFHNKVKTHRVLDDVRASIAELTHYRDEGFINVSG